MKRIQYFVFMSIKLHYKFLLFEILFAFLLTSCNNGRYVVFNANGKRKKISLCDTNQAVILVSFASCRHCLPKIIKTLDNYKKIIIVSAVDKDKWGLYLSNRSLKKKYGKDKRISYLFQYTKKNYPYQYKSGNKLFRKYNYKESPVLLQPSKNCKIKVIKPSNLGL